MTPDTPNGLLTATLRQNTTIIRRRFPHLIPTLEKYEGTLPNSVQLQSSRSGFPTVSISRGTGYVHVHSTFNPIVEAERWAKEPNDLHWDFAVVVGMGLGYHLHILMNGHPTRRVVVLEPEPDLFITSMFVLDHRTLLSHPGLDLIVTRDARVAADMLFQRHSRHLIHQLHFFEWPATSRYAPDYWRVVHNRLLELARATLTNVVTYRRFSSQWISNFFENIETSVKDPGIEALIGHFSGRPGVIVSSGPSLEKNVRLLREVKGKAVIIAAGSAINPLLMRGVEPDLLVSFDPGKANYRHFEDLHTPSLPLVYVPTIYPRIVEEYKGPRFVSAMDVFPFTSWFFQEMGGKKGLLASGPSVANVSWDLAWQMGLNPIILIGQDLAYTDSRSHASGTAHARHVKIDPRVVGSKFLEVESVDGGRVYTNRPMYAMKLWFERRLQQGPNHLVTIDATEGGARIDGTHVMTLREALDRYCNEPFHPHAVILKIHEYERARLSKLDSTGYVERVYRQITGQLSAIDEISRVGARAANHLLRESSTKRLTEQRYHEAATRLERLESKLYRLKAFEIFIQPLTTHVLESIALRIRPNLQKATDLHERGTELAGQYITLFDTVKRATNNIERLLITARRASSRPSLSSYKLT